MEKSSDQIRVLQVLRACAACAVVFIHATDRTRSVLGLEWPAAHWLSERLCNAGVDLFFVISGFLMTRLHCEQFGRPGARCSFFRKRLQRIAPLYWILSAGAALILFAAPKLIGGGRAVSLAWLLGNFLFVPWPQANGTMEHLIVVGWTLDFEMWFYVVFAIALSFRNGLQGMACFLGACVLLGFVIHPTHPWPALLVSPMLLEFLAGAGIALLTRRVRLGAVMAATVLTVGLALLAASTLIHGARYWKDGIPCAVIVLGCIWLAPACRSLSGRVMTVLGDASYSIYLFQIFALPAAAISLHLLGGDRWPAWLDVLLLWAAGSAAGVLCWRYLERPVTAYLKRPQPAPVAYPFIGDPGRYWATPPPW